MIISNPLIITPRLLAGAKIGDSFISIDYSPREGRESRTRYKYFIDAPDFEFEEDELQSGCQGGGLQEGLESLLSFLDAASEASYYPDSDNADLFPPHVMAWAQNHHDEISCLLCDIEEQVIIEE